MKLAILFWFYKELAVCQNRLRLLKRYNPDVPIYGLYGGNHKRAALYEEGLEAGLVDFYTSPSDRPGWKWRHGDLMILDWYEQRGRQFDWDSIMIVQWDMLVFEHVRHLFSGLQKDEMVLSAHRLLDDALEASWDWTTRREQANYLAFLDYVRQHYGYDKRPFCCQFIIVVFPRLFLERYATVAEKEIGMLEYKLPVYAQIFDIKMYEGTFGLQWSVKGQPAKGPLNALEQEIPLNYIQQELEKPGGWRIFHPYYQLWEAVD